MYYPRLNQIIPVLFTIILLFQCNKKEIQSPNFQNNIEPLTSGFLHPPIEARPKGYWDWLNGNFDYSQLELEMKEAKEKGMGGFDIWDVGTMFNPDNYIPPGPEFMSDRSVQAIGYAVRLAEKYEMEMGLTISSSWNAGGTWVKPEHGAMGIFISNTGVQGPSSFSADVPYPQPSSSNIFNNKQYKSLLQLDPKTGLPSYNKDIAVLAYQTKNSVIEKRSIIDLSSKFDTDGKLNWEIPEGDWTISRYVCMPTGQPLMIPSPNSVGLMLDHFSKEAQEANLTYILEKLKAELGSLENRALKYLYTDSYEVNSGIWTPLLAEEFERRRGYSIMPFLPIFEGKVVEDQETTNRFLFDFKKTLSDLIIENHYAYGKEICNRYGLGFRAEAGGPGPPVHNVPFEDLKALGALSAPRGEFWIDHPRGEKHNNELQIVKGISSASHIYNQQYVEAEAFTSVWLWQNGPKDLKSIADRAFCEGLNRIVYHTFPHTPQEAGVPGWVYNFGTLIHVNNSWWPLSKGFHEYLARMSYLMQQGQFVGDVAFYYGDKAPNFVTYKKVHPSLGFGYDYDVVNAEAILNKFLVADGKIYLPSGQFYEILVLPDEDQINLEVLRKIRSMVEHGATVIGRKPSKANGLSDYKERELKINELANDLWGDCDSLHVKEHHFGEGKVVWGKTIREVLIDKGIKPDVTIHGDETAFDFIHRRTTEADIYLIWNRSNKPQIVTADLRSDKDLPQLWDAESGEISNFNIYSGENGKITIPLDVEPGASRIVVISNSGNTIHVKNLEVAQFFSSYGNGLLAKQKGSFRLKLSSNEEIDREINHDPFVFSMENPWEVRFPYGWNAPLSTEFEKLISWTESVNNGIRYFSGVAKYLNSFELTSDQINAGNKVFLNLGKVSEIAIVYLNGKSLGYRWSGNNRYDITEYVCEGKNYLVIEVANVLSNRMTGDARLPEKYRRTKSNVTKGPNAWMMPWAEVPLVESGLLGPVNVEVFEFIELD